MTQIENDETPAIESYKENDYKDPETKKTFAISNFMDKILSDDESLFGESKT